MSETHSQTNFINGGFQTDGGPETGRLADRIVAELRKIAGSDAKKNPGAWQGIDLNDVVGEVFVRLAKSSEPWNDRKHFYRTAARAIRYLRIDYARRRKAMHLDSKISLHDSKQAQPCDDFARAEQLLRLDQALAKLAEVDPEAAEAIELYYFGVRLPAERPGDVSGEPVPPQLHLTQEQIGELIGKSKATVCLRIRRGQDWLSTQLEVKGEEDRP